MHLNRSLFHTQQLHTPTLYTLHHAKGAIKKIARKFSFISIRLVQSLRMIKPLLNIIKECPKISNYAFALHCARNKTQITIVYSQKKNFIPNRVHGLFMTYVLILRKIYICYTAL